MLPAAVLLLRVPDLSARAGHLARASPTPRSAAPASGSAWRTTSSCWGDSVTRLALFNTLFYTVVASVIKFVLGLWLALLLNQQHAVQGLLPRGHPAALHRADGAVGDRLLVDLRLAVLDHQLGAGEDGPDRPLHRLPRRPVERALVDDRRQRLARRARSSRSRCSPACRRSRRRYYEAAAHRRRDAAGSSSATSRCRC